MTITSEQVNAVATAARTAAATLTAEACVNMQSAIEQAAEPLNAGLLGGMHVRAEAAARILTRAHELRQIGEWLPDMPLDGVPDVLELSLALTAEQVQDGRQRQVRELLKNARSLTESVYTWCPQADAARQLDGALDAVGISDR